MRPRGRLVRQQMLTEGTWPQQRNCPPTRTLGRRAVFVQVPKSAPAAERGVMPGLLHSASSQGAKREPRHGPGSAAARMLTDPMTCTDSCAVRTRSDIWS